MIKAILASFLCISFLSGCTASLLSPAAGMGVEQPKIHFKKTRTSLEASASSNFTGDLLFDGEYDKDDKAFKGRLEAHVNSDASTVTESQVEKIRAMENAYNKYADKMTEVLIKQAEAFENAVNSITSIIPGAIGALNPTPAPKGPSAFENILSLWNSLTPEQKQELLDKFTNPHNP